MNLLRIAVQLSASLALLIGGGARAQCLRWSSAFSHGPTGPVHDMVGFDDGSGPALYVTGDFLDIYGEQGHNSPFIYRWDGVQWQDVGLGLQDWGWSLGVHDDGTGPALYVGGRFTSAGTSSALNIAKWTGVDFFALGAGLTFTNQGFVSGLESFDDGSGPALYAIGSFSSSGSTNLRGIARWNGTYWSGVGAGLTSGWPVSMHVFDDGSGPALYIAGTVTLAGSPESCKVAKWNGSIWTPLANSNNLGGGLGSMVTFDDGTGPALYIASPSGGQSFGVSRWTGTDWLPVGSGFTFTVNDLVVFDDGSGPALFAGGDFSVSPGRRVAKWTGSTWMPLGNGTNEEVNDLCVYDFGIGQDLYVGGLFGTVGGGLSSRKVAAWQGCKTSIATFCYGDTTVAACPCSNSGIFGHGCENSASTGGARLYSSGDTNPDSLVVSASGLLPNATTLFFQGSVYSLGSTAFGDGLRCVTAGISRLYVKVAQAGQASAPQAGDLSISARSAALGDVLTPGTIRYYQAWYRDPNPSYCTPATYNMSNGLRVVW